MKVFGFVETVTRFHRLVLMESTGNAAAFSEKLGISRASLYNLISELDAFGIEIGYSRFRETYYYRNPERVKIDISIMQSGPENKNAKNFQGKL